MKLIKYARRFAALTSITGLLVACEKVDQPEPLGDAGVAILKLMSGGSSDEPGTPLTGVNFVTTAQTAVMLDVRRDLPNNAELNQTQTVTVKVDTAMLRIYNDGLIAAGLTPYEIMPSSWYTSNPNFTWGGSFDVTFAPGEFSKLVKITVPNATLFDPSSTYAFPFTITSASPANQISVSKSVISLIGAKNDYDGKYEVTGTFVDVSNAAFTSALPVEIHLITTGASSVDVYNADLGTIGYLFLNGGSGTYYGSFGLTMTFDPSGSPLHPISDLHNYYGDPTKAATPGGNPAAGSGAPLYAASNGRRAVLDPSGVNAFDPSTHDIDIKYFMYHPAVVPSGPRSLMSEHWRYLGSR